MRVRVRYGTDSAEFEVAADRLVTPTEPAQAGCVTDLPAALTAALEAPIEFPPLRQAVIPDDRVAIVVDEVAGAPNELIAPLVQYLSCAGVDRANISLLRSRSLSELQSRPSNLGRHGLTVVEHDPANRQRLSYLATTRAGQRVYLNRAVVDADVVVLLGSVRYDGLLGYAGTASSVYPGLADEPVRQRLRAQAGSVNVPAAQEQLRAQVEEVGWLLGALFAVQVVRGPGNRVAAVLAGSAPAVQRAAQARLDQLWRRSYRRRAELVVAGISEEPARQGFEQLGAAAAAASILVEPNGMVALLSCVAERPGPAIQRCRQAMHPNVALRAAHESGAHDAIAACQIAHAVQRARLLLLSRLERQLVADLFMTPLEDAQQVQSLIDRASSCLILNDAQLAPGTPARQQEGARPVRKPQAG